MVYVIWLFPVHRQVPKISYELRFGETFSNCHWNIILILLKCQQTVPGVCIAAERPYQTTHCLRENVVSSSPVCWNLTYFEDPDPMSQALKPSIILLTIQLDMLVNPQTTFSVFLLRLLTYSSWNVTQRQRLHLRDLGRIASSTILAELKDGF